MILNKHTKFHGDQIIGGAIIAIKAHTYHISMVNYLELSKKLILFTDLAGYMLAKYYVMSFYLCA